MANQMAQLLTEILPLLARSDLVGVRCLVRMTVEFGSHSVPNPVPLEETRSQHELSGTTATAYSHAY